MNSVLFAFTYSPMLAAAYYRLCSRDSAWTGVFRRSARSSAELVSVIVSAGYILFLSFLGLNHFLFLINSHQKYKI